MIKLAHMLFKVMLMTLEQCSKEMEEVFGTSIKFKPTKTIVDSFHDKDAQCEEGEDNE